MAMVYLQYSNVKKKEVVNSMTVRQLECGKIQIAVRSLTVIAVSLCCVTLVSGWPCNSSFELDADYVMILL
jgi:hypothetical protein